MEPQNTEAYINYTALKERVNDCIQQSLGNGNSREIKNHFIKVQGELRNTNLQYGDRQELWELLNQAFENLRTRQEVVGDKNYYELKGKISHAISFAQSSDDKREAKSKLIEVQRDFRGIVMQHTKRQELWDMLQGAFDALKHDQDVEKQSFENECELSYATLKPKIVAALNNAPYPEDVRVARENLKQLQHEMQETKLTKEQRDELWNLVNQAFEILNSIQENKQNVYDKDCHDNYVYLNKKVKVAENQAANSENFPEARQFITTIQKLFKGIKLKPEQREELWQRINEAFNLLKERSGDY